MDNEQNSFKSMTEKELRKFCHELGINTEDRDYITAFEVMDKIYPQLGIDRCMYDLPRNHMRGIILTGR